MSVNTSSEAKSNRKGQAAVMARLAADLLAEIPGEESRQIEDILRIVARDISNMKIPEGRAAQ